MQSNVRRENSQYRRGLVLGLTMAEIMILIIFLLLLSLSMLAKDLDDRLAAAESQRDQARSQLQQVRMHLSLPLSSDDSQDDLFTELRLRKDAAGRETRLGSDIAAARMLVDQARLSFALSGNASEAVSGVLGGDEQARLRATLAASQLVGAAVLRYVMKVAPLATLSDDEMVRLLAPTVTRYLTADASELGLP